MLHVRESEVSYVQIWLGDLGGRDHLKQRRHRWENNIKMDLQKVGQGGMDWFNLIQDWARWQAVVNAAINFRFHIMRGIS
jgi:hypothetical protein